jgi:dephospho-CoA kinase
MLKVALTGNIAAGKSTVAAAWRAAGATIVEADVLAREAVRPGSPGLRRIVERWGPAMLTSSGELDRAALRDVVFRDEAERKHLESIVHPEVHRLRIEAVEAARRRGERILVSDIPLLFETGSEGEYDVVVLVDAPEEVRRARLVGDRGLGPDEADRMIAAQWPAAEKRTRADVVIENGDGREALQARAGAVWRELVERAGEAT